MFQATAASYVASGLFASLVCRPDLSVAIQRMSSWVTKWRASDDIALIRFMSYIKEFHDLQLTGSLAPEDEDALVLAVWPDADWNGGPETAASTSGLYCEIISDISERVFPLTWTVSRQTATASSSAESETVSLSVAVRVTALPLQALIREMIGRTIPVI